MKVQRHMVLILAAACVAFLARTVVAQDEGPILKPKPKPKPSPTLLVMCDLACSLKIDGQDKGSIDAGGSKKVPVSLGHHLVDATTADALDKVEQQIDIKSAEQTIVRINLQAVSDARLKVEQKGRERAAPEQQRKNAATQAEEGQDLFDQWRFAEARPLLAGACDAGIMESCVLLAVCPAPLGHGTPHDYSQAVTLTRKTCDSGSAEACNNLALFYEKGGGGYRDETQARLLFEKICNGGNLRGCWRLSELYQTGHGGTQDPSRLPLSCRRPVTAGS